MALLTYSSKGLVSLLTSGLVMLRHRYCTFTVFGAGDTGQGTPGTRPGITETAPKLNGRWNGG
eukprot:1150296-Pelagomonas_calceolata.AAC.2